MKLPFIIPRVTGVLLLLLPILILSVGVESKSSCIPSDISTIGVVSSDITVADTHISSLSLMDAKANGLLIVSFAHVVVPIPSEEEEQEEGCLLCSHSPTTSSISSSSFNSSKLLLSIAYFFSYANLTIFIIFTTFGLFSHISFHKSKNARSGKPKCFSSVCCTISTY